MTRLRVALGLLPLLLGSPAHADKFTWAGQIDMHAEGLKSEEPKLRLAAVAALGQDDIHGAERYLLTALADDDESVRHQAARALGTGGSIAAVPKMVEWLGDVNPVTRAVAADVLGDIGGIEATQALTRSLGDSDATVRQRAVKSLGKIGLRGAPGVVIALIPRLEDEKADVRRETIEQLEQLGDRRAVIPLVARFGDVNTEVKKSAIRAVGKLGDRSAVPALIRKMSDSEQEEVRTMAVGSLGLLGAVDATDALIEQLGSGSDAFRAKVAYALGQIAASPGAGKAGEDAMRTLVENLAQPNQREAARSALQIAGKAAVPALVAHLTGKLKGDPTTAVTLLAAIHDGGPDARATAALTAELERGRVAMPLVLKALGATGDPHALVPVLGALANKDAAIRLVAMEALRPLLGSDARAGDVLIEHLTDDDLEVRVLAAEYLGELRIAGAEAKLVAFSGAGNPTRLRLASIDALGEIGAAKPETTKALVDVLREGPPELHLPAAKALAAIADPGAIPALTLQARVDRGPTRPEVLRALGGSMRGHPDPAARGAYAAERKLLRELADDANLKVAVAAICALAAAGDPADAPALRTMVERAASDRRRAAAWALGELHDVGSFGVLADALAARDDRLVGDAAWALGELAQTAPKDPHVAPLMERWLYVARHGGWASEIDSAAAVARTLWALPREARNELLAGTRKQALVGLAFHKSRLVRINIALALSSLTGDDEAIKALSQLLRDDASPHVRAAAAEGLARAAAGANKDAAAKIAAALAAAADGDADLFVRQVAKAAQGGARPLPARTEWRNFYVVDASADDTPVRQVAYFVHGPDAVVWASYTDARGELSSEHIPPGTEKQHVWPESRESEY